MISDDDLRAAMAAGIVDETQVARLRALADERAGRRARDLREDEPFELFKGFGEIFVSLGLILMIGSAAAFAAAISGVFSITLALAASCWIAALYFTRARRMILPSIVLVTGYAIGIAGMTQQLLDMAGLGDVRLSLIVFGVTGLLAILLHFRTFQVPFSMFIAGCFALIGVFGITIDIGLETAADFSVQSLFDLRVGGYLALATLIFGLLALSAAMWFDLQDPHRVGRMARSAFWLHLLAAPALVNTVMLTAYNVQGTTGTALTIIGLGLVTGFALVIDRRSFLTAGLAYLAAMIFNLLQQGGSDLPLLTLMLVLGAIITYLGTFWTRLRVGLMRLLPSFPGKDRLPPYSETK
jgi:hypothetical protein